MQVWYHTWPLMFYILYVCILLLVCYLFALYFYGICMFVTCLHAKCYALHCCCPGFVCYPDRHIHLHVLNFEPKNSIQYCIHFLMYSPQVPGWHYHQVHRMQNNYCDYVNRQNSSWQAHYFTLLYICKYFTQDNQFTNQSQCIAPLSLADTKGLLRKCNVSCASFFTSGNWVFMEINTVSSSSLTRPLLTFVNYSIRISNSSTEQMYSPLEPGWH